MAMRLPVIIELKSPKCAATADGGFMQFRPVAYTEPERSVDSSTNAHISELNKSKIPANSTVSAFYGRHHSDLLAEDMYISFGIPGDGYYSKHNYTAWSFTVGYGSPPLESVSLLVIIIVSLGLAVPALLAALGAAWLCARRCRPQGPQPHRFVDDD